VNQSEITIAKSGDMEEILALQKRAFFLEAERHNDFTIRPIVETIEEYRPFFDSHTVLVIRRDDAIVGAVAVRCENGTTYLNRLIVEPKFHGNGIGSRLIDAAVGFFPEAYRIELFTGEKSIRNQEIYFHKGFREFRRQKMGNIEMVVMEKLITA